MTRKRIGLFGGTFNPVHLGHLILAQDALEHFCLEEILFVPCHLPPHKPSAGLASENDRLAMLRLAVRGHPRFSVSPLELRRGGVSYTIDTVRALQAQHPATRFHFIIGSDTLPELHSWREVYGLLERCTFLTLERPGYRAAGMTARRLRLRAPWPAVLARTVFRGHRVDISSSDLRRRIAGGLGVRYLVPPAVERYIERHALYR